MNATARTQRPILVVDDDPKIVRLLRTYLEREGFAVVEASDGQQALAAIALQDPLLIVLDVMLPQVDGMAVLEALRRMSRTPVVMLSARGQVDDRIAGLELGADDYLAKPFSPAELVVRVRRLLERTSHSAGPAPGAVPEEPLRAADLALDPNRHEVLLHGTPLNLTLAEFRLLHALMSADGRVLTRDQLIDALHGVDGIVLDRTIDVHIGRLRQKLGDDPQAPRYVATVRGIGYRMPTHS
jgi:DNA-binding response OmpR family regulator